MKKKTSTSKSISYGGSEGGTTGEGTEMAGTPRRLSMGFWGEGSAATYINPKSRPWDQWRM